MILDVLIALFGSIILGFSLMVCTLINGILYLIESLISLVIEGFTLGRLGKKNESCKLPGSARGGALGLLALLLISALVLLIPSVLEKQVTLVAQDGHCLPFAGLIIQTNGQNQHLRTNHSGQVMIPRFGELSLTIKDARYVEKTWKRSDIDQELIVERTVLGSSLDIISEKLLQPIKR